MALKDYIKGKKQGKEANRMEREAMKDPFLQEALNGFENVAGNHVKIINRLEKRFSTPTFSLQKNKSVFFYWSVAASILLLIGFGVYYLIEKDLQHSDIFAVIQPIENENAIPVDTSMELLAQIKDELQQEALITAEVNKEVIPVSSDSFISPVENDDESSAFTDIVDTEAAELSVLPDTPEQEDNSYSENLILTPEEKKIIQGKILAESGEPLIGVSILKEGTQIGTVTDGDGTFALQLSLDDSSKLIAKYLGYKSQEINPSGINQTVTLEPDDSLLEEVVVVAYGTQRKSSLTGVVLKSNESDSIQSPFEEKEFQTYCLQKADKSVCAGKGATVKLSCFIDETGKPSKIVYKEYSCEDAKKEMDKLFASSPVWTKKNRIVTMTIKW